MKGIPSTKMGGVPTQKKYYGNYQTSFRYYRLEFPVHHRYVPIADVDKWIATDQLYIYRVLNQDIQFLHFRESVGGDNLLNMDDVTISSNGFSQVDLDAWFTAVQDENFIGHTPLSIDRRSVYIDFDFKYAVNILEYSVCLREMVCGWRLLGSNDHERWLLLNDVPPADLLAQYPDCASGVRWYDISVQTGSKKDALTDIPYLYWGVLLEANAYDQYEDQIHIAELELRDSIGGTDLCTGGADSAWIHASGRTYADAFDNNTNTFTYNYIYDGLAYKFASPVKPVTVALTSHNSGTLAMPYKFSVVCSNDGVVWYHVKTFDTPVGTWTGALDTQEFEI